MEMHDYAIVMWIRGTWKVLKMRKCLESLSLVRTIFRNSKGETFFFGTA